MIAAGHDAVFAITGDDHGFLDTGIVIRNGVVHRDIGARDGLAFHQGGGVLVHDETATNADGLLAAGVRNMLSFGPPVVEAGAVVEDVVCADFDGRHTSADVLAGADR